MTDLATRPDVQTLVNDFYELARTDELLGPVFFGALGEGDWSHHLSVVTDFWCTVLLGERSYPGGFMYKHLRLPLRPAHVERWTQTFVALLTERHAGPVTDEALRRVAIMREVLLAKLAVRDGRTNIQ